MDRMDRIYKRVFDRYRATDVDGCRMEFLGCPIFNGGYWDTDAFENVVEIEMIDRPDHPRQTLEKFDPNLDDWVKVQE